MNIILEKDFYSRHCRRTLTENPPGIRKKSAATPKKSQKTMKIWLKEQKMFFWPYHRGGGYFYIFVAMVKS